MRAKTPSATQCSLGIATSGYDGDQLMQQKIRDYLYTGLLFATPVLVLAGVLALWAAISFEGYMIALIILALGGCSFAGARELKPEAASAAVQALADFFGRKNPKQDGASDA
jgi:hypothetical protein